MYSTFSKPANNTRLRGAADGLEGKVAIQNNLNMADRNIMRAQSEHRLVNSSAENNLGALKDGRQDINQQPTQQQWQLAASWATEAQAED